MLQISEPTISRDIEYLRKRADETIKNHIQKSDLMNIQKYFKVLRKLTRKLANNSSSRKGMK
jgi:hypothetical protein